MNTQIIDGVDSLNALRQAWTHLEDNTKLPMQQFIWAQACATVFAREGELRVLVVEDGGEIVAIAPLVHPHGKACLEMLGVAELGEPTDVLYADGDALRTLAAALADLGVPLLLKRVPADSLFPQALEKSFRGRGILFCRSDNSWPWISLDSGWAEPESRLNSKRRSHLHRVRRIADEFGTVTSEVLSPESAALAPWLEEAFAVEAAGWKGETGTAMAMDPLRGAFYRRYAAAACEKGILRLSFLRFGGQAAAMQLGVEWGGELWLLKIGYDNRFARCSPGNLLIRETLRYAALRGLKSLHFLGAVEYWTRQWTQRENSCVTLRGYPFGLRGGAALMTDLAKSGWQKLSRLQRPVK